MSMAAPDLVRAGVDRWQLPRPFGFWRRLHQCNGPEYGQFVVVVWTLLTSVSPGNRESMSITSSLTASWRQLKPGSTVVLTVAGNGKRANATSITRKLLTAMAGSRAASKRINALPKPG